MHDARDRNVSIEEGGARDARPPLLRALGASREPFDSAVSMLQAHLTEVCAGAATVCVADYETGDDAAVASVVERAQTLLSSSLEALDVVTVLYSGPDEPAEPAEPAEPPSNGLQEANPSAAGAVPSDGLADAVVLARMGLRSRQRALRELTAGAARWERLAAADSALRTIQKSLSAVDRALSATERVPPSLSFYERAVDRSLAVRRRYVHLHQLIVRGGPPAPADLRLRLRLSGNAIAHVLGLDLAVHLRTGDRALLMMSHARVRDWLAQRDETPAHAAAGMRLWQDLVNVATMFLDVSKREELVQHDARLVREALRDLPDPDAPWEEAARAAFLDRLRPACGRSAALDALLADPAPSLADLRRVLEELDRSLGAHADVDGPPASGPRVTRPA